MQHAHGGQKRGRALRAVLALALAAGIFCGPPASEAAAPLSVSTASRSADHGHAGIHATDAVVLDEDDIVSHTSLGALALAASCGPVAVGDAAVTVSAQCLPVLCQRAPACGRAPPIPLS